MFKDLSEIPESGQHLQRFCKFTVKLVHMLPISNMADKQVMTISLPDNDYPE